MTLHRLAELYHEHVVAPSLQPHFIILTSFLVTFVIVRLITHRIRDGRPLLFFRNIQHGGTHIHHLVIGILLLLVSGYMLATLDVPREWLSATYGVGAALTLDEFALWLQLRDVYWDREGRRSIDAVIIFATIVGIGGVMTRFLLAVVREIVT
jgi:hypothetical protein